MSTQVKTGEENGSSRKKPSLIAYTVKEIQEQDAIWTSIGAAWSHKSGKGLSIQLDALPTDGRIVLVEPSEKKPADER